MDFFGYKIDLSDFKTMNKQEQVVHIKVLGIDSLKYYKHLDNLHKALANLQLNAEIERLEEVEDFINYNILEIPALMLNGQIVSKGRVPEVEELQHSLRLRQNATIE